MAQLSDGPVEWPWRIQLVHGAHSLQWSHWCPVFFAGTGISVAPLRGQKWKKVSNSNCQRAPKSQGMTIEGKPSTNLPPPWNVHFPVKWSSHPSSDPLVSPSPPPTHPPPPRSPFYIQRVQFQRNLERKEHPNPRLLAQEGLGVKNIFTNRRAESSNARQR